MSIPFFQKELFSDFQNDNGVATSRLVALLRSSPYEAELLKVLSIQDTKGEYIPIHGAASLVTQLENLKKEYIKLDVNHDISTVILKLSDAGVDPSKHPYMFQLDESGHIEVFYDGEDINDIEAEIRSNPIIADPIFSAQSLYFRELCKFDSYANALIEDKQLEIVSTNIDLLQHFYSNKGRSKKFRLIKHTGTGKYFFRALVSTDGYRDYNINVSVVIALVSIYRAMITSQSNYRINLFYLNHSSISVFFENTLTKPISGVGRIKTELILTNDETAQGTVTVTGLFSILVDIKEQTVDLKIKKPENSTRPKEKVLSISHGQRPETAIKQMDVHQGLIDTEKRMIKEAEEISKIKNVEPLINLFKDRLKAKEKTYKDATKAELARVFKDQVTTFKELLEVMSKTQLIFDSEGVEVREFLKYLAYTILVKKGGDSN